eukprot:363442-Chlamydomonas_euryale.AAC.6
MAWLEMCGRGMDRQGEAAACNGTATACTHSTLISQQPYLGRTCNATCNIKTSQPRGPAEAPFPPADARAHALCR